MRKDVLSRTLENLTRNMKSLVTTDMLEEVVGLEGEPGGKSSRD